MPGWRNVPLRDLLTQEFQVSCYIEKDANAAALGELKYGAGKDVNDLVYIMVDVGIGGGIIVNDDIYRGFLGGAGEIGHMMIDASGPPCNCGSNGCLEAVASGIVIEREVYREIGTNIRLEQLLQDGIGQHPFLHKSLVQAGQYLGIAVANLCNALNPPLVILGGKVVEGSDLYFEQAIERARQRILPDFAQRIQIVRAKLGGLSGAIGAATIVFQNTVYQTI
ncbi:ROK family protein [Alicyclobacillus fastidiosus]|nr:hypothetical protein GCM10025859_54680 [Alicyclobacillus fastidiosus]